MLRFVDSLRFVLLRLIKPFILVDTETQKKKLTLNAFSESEENQLEYEHLQQQEGEQQQQRRGSRDNNCKDILTDYDQSNIIIIKAKSDYDLLNSSISSSSSSSAYSSHSDDENNLNTISDLSQEQFVLDNSAHNQLYSDSIDKNMNSEKEVQKKVRFNGNGIDEHYENNMNKENKTLRAQLEKALLSIKLLEYQLNEKNGQLNSMSEELKQSEEANANNSREHDLKVKEQELAKARNKHEEAKQRIEQLNEENNSKNKTIEQLHKRLSEAFESATANGGPNLINENCMTPDGEKVSKLEFEISKLEQRLKDVLEEKEYYKKHHQANSHQASNGNGNSNMSDEFGRELMLANKRKYQLESRLKQMEHEVKEAHAVQQTFERNLKNTEKLLWLEKERSATLESELHSLRRDLDEQRRLNEELNAELDRYHLRDEDEALEINPVLMPNTALRKEGGGEQFVREMENLQKDYDTKINDLIGQKSKAEWRLGEMTQSWHDAKWRVGELEAAVAHKEFELKQMSDRVKQLESVLATPISNMSDEIQRLRDEISRVMEEKSKVEWRLGEVTQFWNDSKWRIGELEGENCHIRNRLENANRCISELENWNEEINSLRKCLDETREQKSRVEWRLGEVTQYWNDTKWRTGELQELINHKDNEISYLKTCLNNNGTDPKNRVNLELLSTKMNGCFVVKKQPHHERHRWNNMITWENTVAKDAQMRRVWFEVDVENESQEVFLIGSFVNWECAMRCESLADNPKRRGVWLELTPGHHEFRFLRNGKWHTAANYNKTHNEFGDANNWRHVE